MIKISSETPKVANENTSSDTKKSHLIFLHLEQSDSGISPDFEGG